MKATIVRVLLVGVLGLGLCHSLVLAQSEKPQRGKAMGKTMTVTGCLQKGDEPNEYSITGSNGKTYGLRSTSVSLGDHLNHKVTVTGRLTKEENEKEEHAKTGTKPEAGDLNVTNLKMISTSCQ